MHEVIAEFIVCICACLFAVACWFDVYINIKPMRKTKELDKRVTALEQGSESVDID